jgi:AraC family transcriptional regulator
MDVEIVEAPSRRAGVVRSDMAHIAEAQGRLWSIVGEAGLMEHAGVVAAAIFSVEVVASGPQEHTRYDASVLVPDDLLLPEGLAEEHVPAGRYARTTHAGSYEGLPGAWGRLTGEWLPSSGHRLGEGVCYEVYRNSPAVVAEDELRTDLYVPLA